jgi:N-acetylneuraminic acid mutarotase
VPQRAAYILGGLDKDSVRPVAVLRYSFQNNTFTTEPALALPSGRVSFGAALYKAHIYVVGGTVDFAPVSSVIRINPLSPQGGWQSVASLPSQRTIVRCVVANSLLFAVGGLFGSISTGTFMKDVLRYNDVNNAWVSLPSYPGNGVASHALVEYGDSFLVLGGMNNVRSVYQFNITTSTWATLASPASDMVSHLAARVGTSIYVFGLGSTQLLIYNIVTNLWSTGAPLLSGRPTASLGLPVVVGTLIYVWGGGANSLLASAQSQVYDTAGNSWTSVANMSVVRTFHAVVGPVTL